VLEKVEVIINKKIKVDNISIKKIIVNKELEKNRKNIQKKKIKNNYKVIVYFF
jgi:hypothetical protein